MEFSSIKSTIEDNLWSWLSLKLHITSWIKSLSKPDLSRWIWGPETTSIFVAKIDVVRAAVVVAGGIGRVNYLHGVLVYLKNIVLEKIFRS